MGVQRLRESTWNTHSIKDLADRLLLEILCRLMFDRSRLSRPFLNLQSCLFVTIYCWARPSTCRIDGHPACELSSYLGNYRTTVVSAFTFSTWPVYYTDDTAAPTKYCSSWTSLANGRTKSKCWQTCKYVDVSSTAHGSCCKFLALISYYLLILLDAFYRRSCISQKY